MADIQNTKLDPENKDPLPHEATRYVRGKVRPPESAPEPRAHQRAPGKIGAATQAEQRPPSPKPGAEDVQASVRTSVQAMMQEPNRQPEPQEEALNGTYHEGTHMEQPTDKLVDLLPSRLEKNVAMLKSMLPQLQELGKELASAKRDPDADPDMLQQTELDIALIRRKAEENIAGLIRWAEREVSWDDKELDPKLRRDILKQVLFRQRPGKPDSALQPEELRILREIERLSAHPIAPGGAMRLRMEFEEALPGEMDAVQRRMVTDLLMMLAPRRRSDVLKRIAQEITGDERVAVREIGKGTEGTVYRVFAKTRSLVIKVFNSPDLEAIRRMRELQQIGAEAGIAPPILDLDEERALGMEHAPHSIEKEWIKEQSPEKRQKHWKTRSLLLLHWVQKLHERGIVHRDLKPSNICLQPLEACERAGMRFDAEDRGYIERQGRMVPVLIDFGLAREMKELEDDPERKREVVGTPQFLAPEVPVFQRYGTETDAYALGCILFELATGKDWTTTLLAAYGLGVNTTDILTVLPQKMWSDPQPMQNVLATITDPDRRKVLAALLDPNPDTRATLPKAIDLLKDMPDTQGESAAGSAPETATDDPPSDLAATKRPDAQPPQ